MGESETIRTQMGKHNRSVMVAMYVRLVRYHPVNCNSRQSLDILMQKLEVLGSGLKVRCAA
jgi:hypothetical protein